MPKLDAGLATRTGKELGAQLVAAHGDSIVPLVQPGDHQAAPRSSEVDVVTHPVWMPRNTPGWRW
ncbi:MAG: hypothetical protein EXR54_04495 [Dehalococcoidia bacterium]|nr:hypothetical protein [Dehalococcoidia bacterium]MSQ16810.1 hypothetical protein [Dehalococcoidia bacterium]